MISIRPNVKSSGTHLCPCDVTVAPAQGQRNLREVPQALSVSAFNRTTGHGCSCDLIEALEGPTTTSGVSGVMEPRRAPRDEEAS